MDNILKKVAFIATILFVFIISLCIFLPADASIKTDNFYSGESRFKKIADYGNDQSVYVDTETGIEYFAIYQGYHAFGSALLDENGEPIKMEIK